jgi:hypothetical protein
LVAHEGRRLRVVVAVETQVGLLRDADDEAPVGVRHPLGQGTRPLPLLGQPLGDERTRGAVNARVDALAPAVELVLEVELVGEAPAGLEV